MKHTSYINLLSYNRKITKSLEEILNSDLHKYGEVIDTVYAIEKMMIAQINELQRLKTDIGNDLTKKDWSAK